MTAGSVVLLHGLGRTGASMSSLAGFLHAAGMETVVINYPSRGDHLKALADGVAAEIAERARSDSPLSFVTHSMGGIVLRQMVADGLVRVHRAVMLAPPNHGSEVVNVLRHVPSVTSLMGPAFLQLAAGTDGSSAWINGLPMADFEVGVIAGRRWTPFFSPLLPAAGDGKVTISATHVEGMAGHRVVNTGHTWIMRDRHVQAQTLSFLQKGRFLQLDGADRAPG